MISCTIIAFAIFVTGDVTAVSVDANLAEHGLDFVRCVDRWMDAGFSIGKHRLNSRSTLFDYHSSQQKIVRTPSITHPS